VRDIVDKRGTHSPGVHYTHDSWNTEWGWRLLLQTYGVEVWEKTVRPEKNTHTVCSWRLLLHTHTEWSRESRLHRWGTPVTHGTSCNDYYTHMKCSRRWLLQITCERLAMMKGTLAASCTATSGVNLHVCMRVRERRRENVWERVRESVCVCVCGCVCMCIRVSAIAVSCTSTSGVKLYVTERGKKRERER